MDQEVKMKSRKHIRLSAAVTLLLGLGLSQAPATAAMPQEPAKAPDAGGFAKYDTNADGRISLEEFRAQKQHERAFTEADGNHDGWLDKDEYVKAVSIAGRMAVADFASDKWITTKVKTMLLKDNVLNGLKIDVDTQNSTVELSGLLESTEQISRAIKVASQVEGVKGIRNDLRLKK
jgi:hyperosmotically inducible periplasmic protein